MSRLQTKSTWDLLVFLLNAMIFILLGAQFGQLMQSAPAGRIGSLLGIGAIISAVVIVVRLLWVPVSTWCRKQVHRDARLPSPAEHWKPVALIAWTSMRGIVSLASALALPLVLANGAPFPFRMELIVITMCVIVVTLLVQGLTLEPLIRAFAFAPERQHIEEEQLARREALRSGAEALEDLSREPWVEKRDLDRLREEMRDRITSHEHHGGGSAGRRRLRTHMINAERRMLVRLRNEGTISDEVLRDLEQELDLEAVRLGSGDAR